jgi:hypothetical protein
MLWEMILEVVAYLEVVAIICCSGMLVYFPVQTLVKDTKKRMQFRWILYFMVALGMTGLVTYTFLGLFDIDYIADPREFAKIVIRPMMVGAYGLLTTWAILISKANGH